MEQPLVSVSVVTYNSARTVIETLDSIFNQTYPCLELIISDDCSTDKTIEICDKWIERHKERFVRTELLTIDKNTGVSANSNRARQACQAEWVKPIAGDDILLPDCVQIYMEYVDKHHDVIYLFSKVECFGASEKRCREVENFFVYDFFSWNNEKQLEYLLCVRNCIPAPTAFYNKKKLNALNIKCDERIPMLEDWPRWINIVKAGVKLFFLDKVLVQYRISEQSLTNSSTLSNIMDKSMALFRIYYLAPELWVIKQKFRAVCEYCFGRKVLSHNKLEWLFWAICLKLWTF